MEIARPLKDFFFRRGFILRKPLVPLLRAELSDSQAMGIDRFIRRFNEKYVGVDLIRIGGSGDGGYLLPDLLGDITHCFSPGVGYTANFEYDLSRDYNIQSFMADASVSSPPFDDRNFFFTRKYLGNHTGGDFITLGDWVRDNLDSRASGVLLQMDIEGGEYDVLTFESDATLKKFSIMIIEFHFLQKMFERHFLQMLSSIFEKIYLDFSICHVHPNNGCGVAELNGFEIPQLLEITFIRNDLIRNPLPRAGISLPHPLDESNFPAKEDIALDARWWQAAAGSRVRRS